MAETDYTFEKPEEVAKRIKKGRVWPLVAASIAICHLTILVCELTISVSIDSWVKLLSSALSIPGLSNEGGRRRKYASSHAELCHLLWQSTSKFSLPFRECTYSKIWPNSAFYFLYLNASLSFLEIILSLGREESETRWQKCNTNFNNAVAFPTSVSERWQPPTPGSVTTYFTNDWQPWYTLINFRLYS